MVSECRFLGVKPTSASSVAKSLFDPKRTSTAWMSSLKVLRCKIHSRGHGPMRTRVFIALIAGIAALPLAAHAQQAVPSIVQSASTDISKCAQNSGGFPQRLDGPRWNGWGADLSNSRFQPAGMAGLTRDQVPLLRLKWAFGFLGRPAAVAQPTIVGGLVFVGAVTARSTLLTQKADAPAGRSKRRRSFEPRSVLPRSLVPTSLPCFLAICAPMPTP